MFFRVLAILALGIAIPVQVEAAGKKSVAVAFVNFPEGTDCNVANTAAKVKKKVKKNEVTLSVRRFAGNAEFFCDLPNGKQVVLKYRKILPAEFRYIGITVAPNGQGHATVSAKDLYQFKFKDVLR